jgi:hypothetical protein
MKKGFWIVVAVLAASIAMNVWFWTSEPETETILKRDTVWRDTAIYEPQPAETVNTGRVVYIRVPMPGERDTLRDTIRDSIDVPVPIVQRRYDDSLYTAWVSGFEPNLDSLRLHMPEVTTTITKTVRKPTPLLTLGVQVGGGYGLIHRQPDIYVGIGGQINLWPRRKRH